ncbi:hypothetical protein BGX34_006006, partial [Mortierella sp. NVP85]
MEYEIYVALSGIVNARMAGADHYFDSDTLDRIKKECYQEEYRRPEKIPGLSKILGKLKEFPERYISRDGLIDYDGISDEVTLLKAKGIKRKQKRGKKEGKKSMRHKMNQETEEDRVWRAVLEVVDYLAKVKPDSSMYEAKVVTIWEHVLYFLSSKALELEAGELPSRATKYQSTCLGTDLSMEVSKSSGGRRLDLQCRVGDLEINNSEFKRCESAKGRREEQLPKNLLINHAMILYLRDHVGLSPEEYELQALDVH